jgi:tagatose 1,6-diphosphate aldolase
MTETAQGTKVRVTPGKYEGISAVANDQGIISAMAIDQRGSLNTALQKAKGGGDVSASQIREFKEAVTEVLSPYASSVLLDPEYGLEAAQRRARSVGLLLAYEQSGYDTAQRGRFPGVLPGWSALRLVEVGADAVKIVMYYDPDDDEPINTAKHAFIERIGAECKAHDVPFFLEPICYSDRIGDEKGFEFARVKPDKVKKYMREFSQPRYGVDVIKVEIPVNMEFVEGSRSNRDGQVAYSRDEAMRHMRDAAAETNLPFIYLSAGVADEVFRDSLELAGEANVPFNGVLCGRATWQDGVPEYANGGLHALRSWLEDRGVENIERLNDVLNGVAKPWWDAYGGKENLEVVAPVTAS